MLIDELNHAYRAKAAGGACKSICKKEVNFLEKTLGNSIPLDGAHGISFRGKCRSAVCVTDRTLYAVLWSAVDEKISDICRRSRMLLMRIY
jgi:hypothetical protein